MTILERLGLDVAPMAAGASRPHPSTRRQGVGAGLLVLAVLGAGYGLSLLDVSVARFVRSLQHPLGYLLSPWLAQWSRLGDWLGGGAQLVALGIGLWLLGALAHRPALRLAGLHSLWAHAVSALLSNGLKRAIGRPRPKFSHAGEFQLWPSMDNGFDSFPSGHAAASFAVAAVLAAHLPRGRWVWYGLAAAISCSRVFRSAHFPTDVMAGAVLGVVAGWIVSHSLRCWRQSAREALSSMAPWVVGVFAVCWLASQSRSREVWAVALFVAGAAVAFVGAVAQWRRLEPSMWLIGGGGPHLPHYVMGTGLVLATAVPPVMLMGGMVLAGRWLCLSTMESQRQVSVSPPPTRRGMSAAGVSLGLTLTFGLLWVLPGLVPLR